MAGLEYEMTYRFRTRGPTPSTMGSPLGELQYWEMTEGSIVGPRLHATIVMPGGDWYRAGADGYGRPNVRVQFLTDDGHLVLLRYEGLVEVTDAFQHAAAAGGETRFEDQYMRMVMWFDTGADQYRWLTQSLFVAEGRIAAPSEIEYRIYRVV